jgi:hypothetical protein
LEPPITSTPYAFLVALSADQQAMLQLLLERGQTYTDLASLLGVDEAEVRARARATLTELAGTDPDRKVGLTDYLLGQADPIGRADAVRHLKDDPADLELATEITQKIRLIAPAAELPRLPGEERRPRPRGAALSRLPLPDRLRRRRPADETAEGGPGAAATTQRGPRTTLSRRQTQLAVGLGSGVVLVVMIVLGIAGVFSGGGDDANAPSTTTDTTTPAASTGPQGFPLTEIKIDDSGNSQDNFPIRPELQPLLPRTQAVYVTLAKKEVVRNAIKTAVNTGRPIVPVKGEPAFTGIVNAASAQRNVIPIPLRAGRGVQGSGAAALALANANQPFFQVRLTGVEQPAKDSAYIAWFVLA